MSITVLSGHTSPETAHVTEDYPYGFRLRCQRRVWIETKKGFGQRVVFQTSNPKKAGLVWNKPKAGTYSNIHVLYLDDATGYIENAGLTFYGDVDKITEFETTYAAALTSERDQKELRMLKAVAARMAQREAARKAAAEGQVAG